MVEMPRSRTCRTSPACGSRGGTHRIATRGDRLVLMRIGFSYGDQGPQAFVSEIFGLVEIDSDERIVALVSFDLEDIAAAFEELEARYLAGEAADHARTWSAISAVYAALNRRELPNDADIGLRRHRPPPQPTRCPWCALRLPCAAWDLTPRRQYPHRSCAAAQRLGAVVSSSREGRLRTTASTPSGEMINLLAVEGNRIQPLRTLRRGRPRRRHCPL